MQARRQDTAPFREAGPTGLRPGLAQPADALQRDRLRVEAVDRVRDVGRKALALEDAEAAPPELPLELRHVSAQHGRRRVEVLAIVEESVVQRRPHELLAHLPVRVRPRRSRQGGAKHRARDVVEAVRVEHLRRIDAFGEGELLIRVPAAVPPGEPQALHEERPLRVHDVAFGDVEL
jgi:hypothetical protein